MFLRLNVLTNWCMTQIQKHTEERWK